MLAVQRQKEEYYARLLKEQYLDRGVDTSAVLDKGEKPPYDEVSVHEKSNTQRLERTKSFIRYSTVYRCIGIITLACRCRLGLGWFLQLHLHSTDPSPHLQSPLL